MRALNSHEIAALQSQGNRALDWSAVFIADGTDLSQIWDCYFHGRVSIGKGCHLRQVRWLENYDIADDVTLFNIGSLVGDDKVEPLEVINENGGRSIYPFPGMTTGMAYLWARYRGRTRLMERLEAFPRQPLHSIGRGTTVRNVLSIRNVWMDEEVSVADCTSLENGVAHRGCRIESGVIAHRFVLGENVHLEMGLRLNDTVVGDNSTLARGEVGNSLLFPAHEQHHNSSFLIAALVQGQSNIASGCTIGSNHNGRTPSGELHAGRGFWPGLCTSLKHNSRFASYTLLAKGDYPAELNITLPFSLVNNNVARNQLEVMPAYWWMHNMYALDRNNTKFANRDKRQRKAQHIEYAVLAPDTVEEIIIARALLREWTAEAYLKSRQEESAPSSPLSTPHSPLSVKGHGMENSKRDTIILKAAKAYEAYEEMLIYYAMGLLHNTPDFHTDEERQRQWVNVGGQLMAQPDVEALLSDIEQGKVNSWNDLSARLDTLWQSYPQAKQRHAYKVLCLLAGANTLTPQHYQHYQSRYAQIQQDIAKKIAANKAKDATNPYRQMVYLDQAEQDAVL